MPCRILFMPDLNNKPRTDEKCNLNYHEKLTEFWEIRRSFDIEKCLYMENISLCFFLPFKREGLHALSKSFYFAQASTFPAEDIQ